MGELNDLVEARLRLLSWIAVAAGGIILILVVALMGAVLFLAVRIGSNAERVQQAVDSNTNTICAVRANTVLQIQQAVAYKKAHPEGTESISLADINASLDRQRDFLDALDKGGTKC